MKSLFWQGLGLACLLSTSVWAADSEEAFVPLFNGKDTSGWKLRNPKGHNSWTVEGGVLKNTVSKQVHGTDLLTEKQYKDFTVRFEYMVPDGSNSGFYLRGRHEVQILGDFKPDGKPSKGGNGALYAFKEPDKFVSRPGNEWQTCEATIIGSRITVTLNGVKVHDNVDCPKPTGGEINNRVNEPGPILLQGDHGIVSFRNLRIKELK